MKKQFFLLFSIISFGIFVFSAVQFIRIDLAQKQSDRDFRTLREQADSQNQTTASDRKYRALAEQNPDFIGWIRVDGTKIDYPVMQKKDDPEYYLEHNFEKEYDARGVPFLDGRCDLQQSDQYVLYGHHMRDGSMFADLMKFTDPSFCEAGHLITFDTLNESGTWQPVMVFKISADRLSNFPYHEFVNFSSEGLTAEDFISRCKLYAIWSDESADLSDAKLLSLSTCEYSYGNGRLVVVAKKIESTG